MKVAVSIPEPVFKAGEHLAQQLKVSRSQLYSKALSAYLGSRSAAAVTAKLNAVYAAETATVEGALSAAQFKSVGHEAW